MVQRRAACPQPSSRINSRAVTEGSAAVVPFARGRRGGLPTKKQTFELLKNRCDREREFNTTTLHNVNAQLLERCNLFRGAPIELVHSLARLVECQVFLPGDVVLEAESCCDALFIISRGEVLIEHFGGSRSILGKGDCFGEEALLDKLLSQDDAAHARVMTDCLMLPRTAAFRCLQRWPAELARLRGHISAQLQCRVPVFKGVCSPGRSPSVGLDESSPCWARDPSRSRSSSPSLMPASPGHDAREANSPQNTAVAQSPFEEETCSQRAPFWIRALAKAMYVSPRHESRLEILGDGANAEVRYSPTRCLTPTAPSRPRTPWPLGSDSRCSSRAQASRAVTPAPEGSRPAWRPGNSRILRSPSPSVRADDPFRDPVSDNDLFCPPSTLEDNMAGAWSPCPRRAQICGDPRDGLLEGSSRDAVSAQVKARQRKGFFEAKRLKDSYRWQNLRYQWLVVKDFTKQKINFSDMHCKIDNGEGDADSDASDPGFTQEKTMAGASLVSPDGVPSSAPGVGEPSSEASNGRRRSTVSLLRPGPEAGAPSERARLSATA